MIEYGLIGFPLEHSQSPDWFNNRFAELPGWERSYRLFPLKTLDRFKALLLDHPNLAGLNVTIPYKELIIPFLDDLDPSAGVTGAVNTLTISRAGSRPVLRGYNTDWAGFFETIPDEMKGEKALILGSGGAARAVGYALALAGIPFVVVSRTKTGKGIIGWSDLTGEVIASHHFIINTTPLGMFPATGEAPSLPYDALTSRHFLYDLIYNPEMTLFLKSGQQRQAHIQNGRLMLINQAKKALEIFLKHEASQPFSS